MEVVNEGYQPEKTPEGKIIPPTGGTGEVKKDYNLDKVRISLDLIQNRLSESINFIDRIFTEFKLLLNDVAHIRYELNLPEKENKNGE